MDKEKIQRQFDDRYAPVPEAGCWIWLDKSPPAQRTAWLLEHGAKPPRQVRQTCGIDDCVNPAHLSIDTDVA